jgi:hypothetical protein
MTADGVSQAGACAHNPEVSCCKASPVKTARVKQFLPIPAATEQVAPRQCAIANSR